MFHKTVFKNIVVQRQYFPINKINQIELWHILYDPFPDQHLDEILKEESHTIDLLNIQIDKYKIPLGWILQPNTDFFQLRIYVYATYLHKDYSLFIIFYKSRIKSLVLFFWRVSSFYYLQ